ncbi:MAG: hypothetical protein GX766_04365 [Firmicutes bacterium]|nr:hypothetical protein [Bacillota bacterium]HQD39249.1 hypothetical protein [Bacillota bacterium]
MKTCIYALCILFCFTSLTSAFVQCSIEDRVVKLRPGERGQLEIELYNPEAEQRTVRAYLGDWELGTGGEPVFHPAGTLPNSAAGQLKLADPLVVLGPGERGKLRLEVEVPKEQRGSRAAMLFVEAGQLPPPTSALENQMQISVQTLLRYGIKIYVVAQGTEEPASKINDLRLQPPSEGKIPVNIVLQNSGNIHLRYQCRLEVRSLEGEVLEEKELAPFSILPGAVRTVQSEIKLPPFGKYLLLAVLDYGSEKLLAAEAPFEIREGGK